MSSVIFLPDDVMYEILSRLPAKSILNCKYVCKTWFSLISNPSFVKRHTIQNKNKQSSKFMFMIQDDTKPYYPLVRTLSYDDDDDALYSSSFVWGDDRVEEIDPPFIDLAIPIHVLGSCDGLICIMFQTNAADGLVHFLVIWNPTTREYKILPNSQTRVTNMHYASIYSFGYDHKNDDYKLVKGEFSSVQDDGFVKLPPCEEDVHVSEVYSLRSDSWRSIETIPYHMLKYIPYDSVSGVFVNGLRHWLAKRFIVDKDLQDEFIVSFDFSEERFEQMHLPKPFLEIGFHCLWSLGVLEECLCVTNYVWEPRQVEIWVMRDYGIRESWTKHFVIRQEEVAKRISWQLGVIWSFKDDKNLLLKSNDERERQLVLYDPEQDTLITSSLVIRGAENYVESLVSLNSGIYVGNCQEYANILHASWTKRLRLFEYEVLLELLGMTLVVLWLAMGSVVFNTQTIRKRFGQFVMVSCWLNSEEFKFWWWRGIQPAASA